MNKPSTGELEYYPLQGKTASPLSHQDSHIGLLCMAHAMAWKFSYSFHFFLVEIRLALNLQAYSLPGSLICNTVPCT